MAGIMRRGAAVAKAASGSLSAGISWPCRLGSFGRRDIRIELEIDARPAVKVAGEYQTIP